MTDDRVSAEPSADDARTSSERYICVGAIAGAHGVKGDVKITSFTGEKTAIADFHPLYGDPDMQPLDVSFKSPTKTGYLGRVKGIETREQAMAAKGTKLFIRRDQLPAADPDEFYVSDLEGLSAINPAGKSIGEIRTCANYGGGDVLEVNLDAPRKGIGRVAVVPFKQAYVPDVDIKGGQVTVDLDAWIQEMETVPPTESNEKE